MTVDNPTLEESIAAVDGLPNPTYTVKASPLSLVKLRDVAIDAAQQGFCEVALGNEEGAAGAVARAAEVLIISLTDVSPDGWARLGARDGILSAWGGEPVYRANLSGAALDMYTVAHTGTCWLVRTMIDAEQARREKDQARNG